MLVYYYSRFGAILNQQTEHARARMMSADSRRAAADHTQKLALARPRPAVASSSRIRASSARSASRRATNWTRLHGRASSPSLRSSAGSEDVGTVPNLVDAAYLPLSSL